MTESVKENREFHLKTRVLMGTDSLKRLTKLKGSSAFIVADQIMEELGYLQLVVDDLKQAGIHTSTFTGVKPDPDTSVIAAGLKQFQAQPVDLLIAIGGGSAIDAAKGILYTARQMFTNQAKGPYFVAIPSTSGTGSEVTNFSVITADGDKICIVDDLIAPDLAILDTACIKNVPQKVVVDTGIDVLVHATEAYVSNQATDFTDAMAEKTIRLLFEHLPVISQDISNDISREKVHNASCMAGIAFTNAGLGITHSLAHAVGGKFHLAHGRCNALLLEAVIAYNADLARKAETRAAQKYAQLAEMLGLPARTTREGVVSYLDAVKQLKKQLAIETGFQDFINEESYQEALSYMAQAALKDRCTSTNPRQPSQTDIEELYRSVF